MKLNTQNIEDKLVYFSDGLKYIREELTWILNETTEQQIQPKTDLGNELNLKFDLLYRDFQKLRNELFNFNVALHETDIDDKIMQMVYRAAGDLLLQRSSEGLFEDFISVAETGNLPEVTE